MALRTKNFTIRFYKVRYGADGKNGSLWGLIESLLKNKTALPVMPAGDTSYHVRGITKSLDGNSISAYLVRFRQDKPAVGSKATLVEEYLELDEGKEFLEKNHFIIFREAKDVEIIGYQCCREGGVISALARYFTYITSESETITFDDILTKESLEAIFKKGLIKSVEFSVARPVNKDYHLSPEDSWTQDAFDMLKDAGAFYFNGKIGVKSRSAGLLKKTRTYIRELMNSDYTKKLKVKVSGEREPIDLFAERIHGKIEVTIETNGVILAEGIFDGIRRIKDYKQYHLDANFKEK